MEIKAVLFDLDGTLVNSLDLHLKSFEKAFADLGFEAPSERIYSLFGVPARTIIKLVCEENNLDLDQERLLRIKRKYYSELIKMADVLLPGVREMIPAIKENYRLAIVTSSSEETLHHSLKDELLAYFDEVVTADEVERGKPDPQAFTKAAEKLKIEPHHCLAVGDAVVDLQAAMAAGMKAVGVTTGLSTREELEAEKPLKVVGSVAELAGLL